MQLAKLKASSGRRKKRRRVGRGKGSGWGKTAGRGHKGQLSRSGATLGVGFEGGQMPLQRRMPKRGFKNYCGYRYVVVHCGDLERFEENSVVDPVAMCQAGLLCRPTDLVKILSDGKLQKPLTVRAQGFSKAAKGKIEAVGGKAEVIEKVRRQLNSEAEEA